ncbi:MAG TPA: terminase small subunit [Gemmatimonadaceae bacterium]|nr:terminase small subunit [Gemmatimonadaceae bacterium]
MAEKSKSSAVAEKTANKTAKLAPPSGRNGNRLPVGAHSGNTGGKPGRSGRPSRAFKATIAELQRDPDLHDALREAASDPNHKNFAAAWGVITKFGPLDDGQQPAMTPEQAMQLIAERLSVAAERRKAAIMMRVDMRTGAPAGCGLTAKQGRFVDEYLIDLNATQAAIRAGYSERTARFIGAENLTKPNIAAAIAARTAEVCERLGLTKEWVLTRLKENVERAMQAEPVKDSKGKETGEYTYQGAAANKALELLGKHVGLFTDKLDVDFNDLSSISDAELERRRRELRLV